MSSRSQCPDIFVYLCAKQKRVSFARFRFSEVVKRKFKVPPGSLLRSRLPSYSTRSFVAHSLVVWTTLQEDISLDALSNEEFPGSLLFSLRAGLDREKPPTVLKESRPMVYDLVNEVYDQARALFCLFCFQH